MSYDLIILTVIATILFIVTLLIDPRRKISLWLDILVIAVMLSMLALIIANGY